MSQTKNQDVCGCCEGIDQETPLRIFNLPSQTTINYRIGRHSKFKESMLAALTNANRPALLPLGIRDDDDFTIAYLDGVATVLDVLTFYQERYVNEHFLATSTERRSVLEMAQLIGYELSPGVAASTHLAFNLLDTPGIPESDLEPITIPTGTRVQSVPGQDEVPQIFETTQDVAARAQWNAVAAQTTFAYVPEHGDLEVYINGIDNNIDIGDAILLVGQNRMDNSGSERWDIRIVKQVTTDNENLTTQLVWDNGLGHVSPTIQPTDTNVSLFVFRKRNSLFGHNAPDPRLMSEKDNQLDFLLTGIGVNRKWENFNIKGDEIDLASAEEKIVAGSWLALVSNQLNIGTADLPGYVELYRVKKVSTLSRTDYGISGKTTRIKPDTDENIGRFREKLQQTQVLLDSEKLSIHQRPIKFPLYSDSINLETHIEGLVPEQYLSVSGQQQRLKVAPGITDLKLDGSFINEGDSLILVSPPEKIFEGAAELLYPDDFGKLINKHNSSIQLQLHLQDRDGNSGIVLSKGSDWLWDNHADGPRVAEIVQIAASDNAIQNDRDRTTLTLSTSLVNIYQRNSVRINFNVAPATQGETVTEILGDGDARKTDQRFSLKQAPLTYISADTPSGGAATLELRVNNLRWDETASLYQAEADARVYQINNRDDGSSEVLFGDGVEGGRLPTGQTNVRAVYRKYIGSDANLVKGKITTLLQKPLGVTEVTNPQPATGGANAEVIEDAKQNAPLTVMTLDRAVSVDDYRHYARAFSGVAKAHALWINAGPSKGIYITLAGIDGAEIPSKSRTYINLTNSLRRYGDPMLPLNLVNHISANFELALAVKVHEAADRDNVIEALLLALRDHFSFENRDFGQHVSQDEILAVAHSVNYVEAVRITRFYKQIAGAIDSVVPIIASPLPIASLTVAPTPAELLTLSDKPIEIGAFS